jgi:hypothetical protein
MFYWLGINVLRNCCQTVIDMHTTQLQKEWSCEIKVELMPGSDFKLLVLSKLHVQVLCINGSKSIPCTRIEKKKSLQAGEMCTCISI